MGFTVEDMLLVSQRRYRMKLIAGKGGWSNSISWLLMLEDLTIVQRFSGKELAVTTGLGFQTEEKLSCLVRDLIRKQASGLIINTGGYLMEVPSRVKTLAEEGSLPLLTVPWDVELAEMIKDLSIRIFLQGSTDEQISAAFQRAIEAPEDYESYSKDLLAHFDLEGSFQVVLLHRKDLAEMDTVERKRIGYRLQLALTNLTHNGHFFYYDSCFVVIMNAVDQAAAEGILRDFAANMRKRIPERPFLMGVGSSLPKIRSLSLSYRRAKAAIRMGQCMADICALSTDSGAVPCLSTGEGGSPAWRWQPPKSMDERQGLQMVSFDRMGIYRLFSMVDDKSLLLEYEQEVLGKLETYDRDHHTDYVRTLETYLLSGGSIQKVARAMFIHRNTISYRMNHIREILGNPLEEAQDRMVCLTACLIRHMIPSPLLYPQGDLTARSAP